MSQELLSHEIVHLLLTLAAILLSWIVLRKNKHARKYLLPIIIGAFLGEFFLDADHLFDYLLVFGLQFQPSYFFSGKMFDVSNKIYVPFHSWEFIPILVIITYLVKNKTVKYFLVALTIGFVLHMVYDNFFNGAGFFGYSFIYRMIHNFGAQYFSAMRN